MQKITTKLHTKSMAQLDEEIKKILAENHEDENLDGLFYHDGSEWCGPTPEPLVNGRPAKEYEALRDNTAEHE
jgi:hypothetical protein